jgi:hypothetical protein
MSESIENIILKSTGANSLVKNEHIQTLWSGYGTIDRYQLFGSELDSVVVKHIQLGNSNSHPRGWDTDFSHQRKLKSYDVETSWYQNWASRCDDSCRIPKAFAIENRGNEILIILEDLDSVGYSGRKHSITWEDMQACIKWLANFHAKFIGIEQSDLWEVGTYWHLATRPDEHKKMSSGELKEYAHLINQKLNNCKFKSLVHGDAKLANFCFSKNENKVAAVDFQYIGGGCGMKDLAYFVGSCLYEDDCEEMESQILDYYFSCLEKAVDNSLNYSELEKEWREMYSVAWADFHRFLKGWSPDHWKINSYSERVSREVINSLK